MEEYIRSYIAFLDILGFKSLIKSKTCQELHSLFSKHIVNPLAAFSRGSKPVLDMKNVHMKVMSDSICFYIDSSIENALAGLMATCLYFQIELLRLDEPVLLRGAIVCGDIFADGDILFGPGFVDAYLMEENNASVPRIIITKQTIDSALEHTSEEVKDYYEKMTFCDYDEFYSLDHCELFEGLDTFGNDCRRLLKHINKVLGAELNSSVRDKYLYLKKHLLRWFEVERSER